jgi:hypothetical protein
MMLTARYPRASLKIYAALARERRRGEEGEAVESCSPLPLPCSIPLLL